MLIKQKSPLLPRKLAPMTFGELLILFSTKVNLLHLYSTAWRCCLLHLLKQNYLLKTFLRTLILITQVISLPVFPSRTNLKLHHISVIPTMVKKIIVNLILQKHQVLIVFQWCSLKTVSLNSHIDEHFNMLVEESCFLDCQKISSVVPAFKNAGERSSAKKYCPVSLLSAVRKKTNRHMKSLNNSIVMIVFK